MRTDRTREIERLSKARRTARLKRSGLNNRGREYQRRPNLKPEERHEYYRKKNLAKYHRLRRQRLMMGQTSRGKIPFYTVYKSRADAGILELQITAVLSDLKEVYEDLPPQTQARTIQLAHSIAHLRTRIQEVM